MKLDALLLADAATVTDDGKFFIHGGGFTRFEIPALPAAIPITVLARLRVEDGDKKEDQILNFALIGPAGIPNVEPIDVRAVPPAEKPQLADGQEQFLQIALEIPAVAIRDGLYRFELRLNGRLLKQIPLPVVISPNVGEI